MTVYTALTISGVEYSDAINIDVDKAISDNNSVSSFNTWFYNTAGIHKSDFNMNDEVKIYSDNSPLFKPIAHFTFNQSGTFVNSTVNSYSGLCLSGVDWASGIIGSAIKLNGSPAHVQINSDFGISGGSAMSVCAWIYSYANQNQFTNIIGALDTQWCLNFRSSTNYLNFYISGSYPIGDAVLQIPNNQWCHIVGTKSPTKISIYYNGSFIGSASHTRNIPSPSINYVGFYGNGNRYFSGLIDDVRVYNKELSQGEIDNIYNSGIGTENDFNDSKKLFDGILENISFEGEGLKERITLDGRDYSARLMDTTVEPEVYVNLPAGSIIKDIVTKYVSDLNVGSVQDGTTITKMAFNQINCYDAVKQLADQSEYMFYVDKDKYLHFEPKGSTSSNVNLTSGNVVKADFQERRDTIYNNIWVYGDRYFGGLKEEFNVGSLTGSIATLKYKPHNTLVEWNGTSYKGGVLEMTYSQLSGIGYLVDFDNKYIIFTSGTTWGDNIPTTGSGIIYYDRDLPIVKVDRDDISISAYGKRTKLIINKDIKDPLMAENIMKAELAKNKDPKIQGNLDLKGVINLTPGNTVGIYLPNHDISGNAFDLLNCKYNFNTQNNRTEKVLNVTVNKKLHDVTDTIKEILLNLKKVQNAEISTDDVFTRYHTTTGSILIRQSGCVIWTNGIGSSFILGHPINSLLGSYSSHSLGNWGTGSSIYWSGGYLE